MISRRTMLQGSGLIAAGTLSPRFSFAQQADLRKIRVAIGQKTIAPNLINLLLADALGYLAEEKLSAEFMTVGPVVNAQIAADRGEADIATGNPSFSLPVLAKGEWGPSQHFYQYTYPYKWDVAVGPNSSLKSYSDLKGKTIGVTEFGGTEFPVTKNVLKKIGIDPDKDVKWIAVGAGVPAGVALSRGAIDALAYYDTGFGQIEAAKIEFRLLERPNDLPMIGGFFLMANREKLKSDPSFAIGYGRAVTKASVFLIANPRAGAKAFLKRYPDTAPRGAGEEEAIASILTATQRRISLYAPPYAGAKIGSINPVEFTMEAEMNGMKLPEMSGFFTNALIDEINNFDRSAIEASAKAAK